MMKNLASRTSILEEVLEVEAEIKQIMRNPTYVKIVRNLKLLKGLGFGNPVRTIPSPDDFNKNVEVRRHSKEMKEIMRRYDERRLEYDKKIKDLLKRRKNLENQLFE
jgi:hypothetical protein